MATMNYNVLLERLDAGHPRKYSVSDRFGMRMGRTWLKIFSDDASDFWPTFTWIVKDLALIGVKLFRIDLQACEARCYMQNGTEHTWTFPVQENSASERPGQVQFSLFNRSLRITIEWGVRGPLTMEMRAKEQRDEIPSVMKDGGIEGPALPGFVTFKNDLVNYGVCEIQVCMERRVAKFLGPAGDGGYEIDLPEGLQLESRFPDLGAEPVTSPTERAIQLFGMEENLDIPCGRLQPPIGTGRRTAGEGRDTKANSNKRKPTAPAEQFVPTQRQDSATLHPHIEIVKLKAEEGKETKAHSTKWKPTAFAKEFVPFRRQDSVTNTGSNTSASALSVPAKELVPRQDSPMKTAAGFTPRRSVAVQDDTDYLFPVEKPRVKLPSIVLTSPPKSPDSKDHAFPSNEPREGLPTNIGNDYRLPISKPPVMVPTSTAEEAPTEPEAPTVPEPVPYIHPIWGYSVLPMKPSFVSPPMPKMVYQKPICMNDMNFFPRQLPADTRGTYTPMDLDASSFKGYCGSSRSSESAIQPPETEARNQNKGPGKGKGRWYP